MTVNLNKNLTTAFLQAGLIAGTLDITAACTDYFLTTGKGPAAVLRYVASGLFGNQAFTGGRYMLAAGLLIHYFFAFLFTCFFFWLYARTRLANWPRGITAIVYGNFIWTVMNLGIVRLSRITQTPIAAMQLAKIAKSLLILICMIGLPLSFIAHRYFK